jgi:hypothetical protein
MPELTPAQLRMALDILLRNPSAEDREFGTRQIAAAFRYTDLFARQHELSSTKSRKECEQLLTVSKTFARLGCKFAVANSTSQWDRLAPLVQEHIEWCEQRLDEPPSPRQMRWRKWWAVQFAWLLLYDWDRPITRGQHSSWARLAAILSGDHRANLYGSLK